MAGITPGERASTAAPTRRSMNVRRLLQLLPGVLAALLFLTLATGDFFLGQSLALVRTSLVVLLLGAIAVQPKVIGILRRGAAWPAFWHNAAVAGVVGVALWLRIWGRSFGLPYLEHPDEWAVADRALEMLRTADYSPHSFVYPTLYTYLQLGLAAVHFVWGVSAGFYRTLAEIDPARFYLWGRTLTAVLGTGAVLCTYAIGRLLYGGTAGILAAALLAIFPSAVGDAHYITTDTPAMFFSMLAFLAIARLALRPPAHRGNYAALALLAGIGVGLAIATKYNVAVLIVPLLLAIVVGRQEQRTENLEPTNDQRPTTNEEPEDERRETRDERHSATDHGQRTTRYSLGDAQFSAALLALLGAGLGFTLGTPMWLRELPQMLNDIASVIVHYRFTGHPGAESAHPALFYWDSLVAEGRLLAWTFLGGALLAFLRRSRADLLILSFAVPSFLQLVGVKVVFFRNVMPLLPFLCLLAAALLVAAADWLGRTVGENHPHGTRPKTENQRTTGYPLGDGPRTADHRRMGGSKGILLALALLILAAEPLVKAVRDDWLRAQPTTRILATEWVEQHAPDGVRIWLEDQTLILPSRLRVLGGAPATTHDLNWYRTNGFRFLVVREDARRDNLTQLAQFGAPAARFVSAGQRHGPPLAIYDTGLGGPSHEPRTPSGARLGGGTVVLEGYQHPTEARAGAVLPLALYWRAARELPSDYTVYVHLLDAAGNTVAQRDLPPLDGSLPTTRWKPGDLIRDDQDLPIPATLPPGTYKLVVGMYDAKTQVAINDNGPIEIGEVVIR